MRETRIIKLEYMSKVIRYYIFQHWWLRPIKLWDRKTTYKQSYVLVFDVVIKQI